MLKDGISATSVSGYYTSGQVDTLLEDYYTETEFSQIITGYSVTGHQHVESDITDLDKYTTGQVNTILEDYYTETEFGQIITGYSITGHQHIESDITDLDKYTTGEVNTLFSGYYTSGQVDVILENYYTETEFGEIITGYSITGHSHIESDITDLDKYTTGEINTLLDGYLPSGAYYTEGETEAILTGFYTPLSEYNTHSGTSSIHFLESAIDKYTQSEVQSLLSGHDNLHTGTFYTETETESILSGFYTPLSTYNTHSGTVDAHHTRYTDAEAEAVSINNLSEDGSPQLGANLDVLNYSLFSSTHTIVSFTDAIDAISTVASRFSRNTGEVLQIRSTEVEGSGGTPDAVEVYISFMDNDDKVATVGNNSDGDLYLNTLVSGRKIKAGNELDMNTHKITSLTNGSSAQDAAAFGQIGSAITTHASDDDAHHTPYTDSDTEGVITAELVDGQSIDNAIDSLISSHASDDDAHHTRYTDAEAQAVSINNLSEDSTPQLGGDLDVLGYSISSSTGSVVINDTLDLNDNDLSTVKTLTFGNQGAGSDPYFYSDSAAQYLDFFGFLRLQNDSRITWLNNAGTGTILGIKVNTSDDLEFAADLDMGNNNIDMGTGVITSDDGDTQHIFGRAAIGYATGETADKAYFGHRDQMGTTNSYALFQNSTGETQLNSKSGLNLVLAVGASTKLYWNAASSKWITGGDLDMSGFDLDMKDAGITDPAIIINITHSVAAGSLVYMNGATPTLADADAAATMPAIGISLGSNQIQTGGVYTTTGLTAGGIYYVSTTGTLTITKPSGTGDQVQRIGVALSTTRLLLQISLDVLTVG